MPATSAAAVPTPASPASAVEDPLPEHNDSPSETQIETSNQFTSLVEASAVHFSSTREVDKLSETAVKLRLSRGQSCVILGTCTLWIKEGSVSLYGSTLPASTCVHRIYAPNVYALPSIEAVTQSAEFQLESLDDGVTDLPYIGNRDLWRPPGVGRSALTFYISGYSFDRDQKAPKRLRELNCDPWKRPLSELSSVKAPMPPKATCPRIVVCGRPSSGLSTFARCLVNAFLARQSGSPPKGVLFLDLDTKMPEFTPPGTISLVLVRQAVFGPSFTHLSPTDDVANQVLRQHFLGDFSGTDLSGWHVDRVHNLLDVEKKHRDEFQDTPVIMVVPKWLSTAERHHTGNIWKKLSPTNIVCLDPNTNSPHLLPWRSWAGAGETHIHHIAAPAFDKMSPAREHDLQMQSYFHLAKSPANRPIWSEIPIFAANRGNTLLTYGGDEADVSAIVLLGGHVALEDTYDAVEGGLVAVVAVEAPTDTNSPSWGMAPEEWESPSVDRHGANQHPHRSGVYRTAEDLPRLMHGGFESAFPIPAEDSCCIGLAIVTAIDIPKRQIALVTPISHELRVARSGQQVALVMQKATSDGRFRIDWARREIGAGSRG